MFISNDMNIEVFKCHTVSQHIDFTIYQTAQGQTNEFFICPKKITIPEVSGF